MRKSESGALKRSKKKKREIECSKMNITQYFNKQPEDKCSETETKSEQNSLIPKDSHESDSNIQYTSLLNDLKNTPSQENSKSNADFNLPHTSHENNTENFIYSNIEKISTAKADDPVNKVPRDTCEFRKRFEKGPYQPKLQHFPRTLIGNRERSFQEDWYANFNWIEYSEELDAVFCFPCRLFGIADSDKVKKNAFNFNGFRNWKKGYEAFHKHEQSQFHIINSEKQRTYENTNKGIDELLDESKIISNRRKEEQRQKNREIMERYVEIVRKLIIGGRPFRGHKETANSSTQGLFLDVVNLIAKYDKTLRNHLKFGPSNAKYTSNRSQNDFIASFNNVVLQKIIDEIKNKKLSVIADETSDCGHHEQLAVAVRFLNAQNTIVERFVGLTRMLEVDANSIFNAINEILQILKVPWENVLTVCFDGARSMSGSLNGVQAKCKNMNKKILYVHCFAHCLNLALVESCTSRKNNPVAFDFFGVVQIIYNFLEVSAIRHAVLEGVMEKMNKKLISLKSLSQTRWACRAEAVNAIKLQLNEIISALRIIEDSTNNPETKINASNVLRHILDFKFVVALEVFHPILQIILKVSKTLQTENINLITAMEQVESLKKYLSEIRNQDAFKSTFSFAISVCNDLDIQLPQSGLKRKRKLSSNIDMNANKDHQYENLEEDLRITFYYPLLDNLINALEKRFNQEIVLLIRAMGNLLDLNFTSEHLKVLCDFFLIVCNGFSNRTFSNKASNKE